MSKRVVFFNHKGGVSKTTSTYNIGWMLSKSCNVLIVDADPQCNLSSLVLGNQFEAYYDDEKTKKHNIKDGVRNAFDGRPFPISAVDCPSPPRAPRLFLLAGHANLSEYDGALMFAQTASSAISTLQNLPGAFSELLRLISGLYPMDNNVSTTLRSDISLGSNFIVISFFRKLTSDDNTPLAMRERFSRR